MTNITAHQIESDLISTDDFVISSGAYIENSILPVLCLEYTTNHGGLVIDYNTTPSIAYNGNIIFENINMISNTYTNDIIYMADVLGAGDSFIYSSYTQAKEFNINVEDVEVNITEEGLTVNGQEIYGPHTAHYISNTLYPSSQTHTATEVSTLESIHRHLDPKQNTHYETIYTTIDDYTPVGVSEYFIELPEIVDNRKVDEYKLIIDGAFYYAAHSSPATIYYNIYDGDDLLIGPINITWEQYSGGGFNRRPISLLISIWELEGCLMTSCGPSSTVVWDIPILHDSVAKTDFRVAERTYDSNIRVKLSSNIPRPQVAATYVLGDHI